MTEMLVMVERVLATDAALELIERLRAKHGPLMFHQSGGCCDGSAPMCYPKGEFRVGGNDVQLGAIGGCDVYMDADQFDYWKHTQLIIDVVPGRGSGFSLEAPEGVRFLTRSRVFTDDEVDALAGVLSRPTATVRALLAALQQQIDPAQKRRYPVRSRALGLGRLRRHAVLSGLRLLRRLALLGRLVLAVGAFALRHAGRYGRRAGTTKGLVSTALLFFATHCSNRSNAAVLWSSGTRMVAPAATTFSALAERSPDSNFLSFTSIDTEFGSAATSVSKLSGPSVIFTG